MDTRSLKNFLLPRPQYAIDPNQSINRTASGATELHEGRADKIGGAGQLFFRINRAFVGGIGGYRVRAEIFGAVGFPQPGTIPSGFGTPQLPGLTDGSNYSQSWAELAFGVTQIRIQPNELIFVDLGLKYFTQTRNGENPEPSDAATRNTWLSTGGGHIAFNSTNIPIYLNMDTSAAGNAFWVWDGVFDWDLSA